MEVAKSDCGWIKLYTDSGVQVTLPVPPVPTEYIGMLANVKAALAAGFLVTAPGLEVGEEREDVGFLVRGIQENAGEETPFLLLYSSNEAMKFSFLKVYLNKPDDVADFEYASKMRLSEIPVYIGRDAPERGKSRQIDKFITQARQPFGVVYKQNPKWSEVDKAAAEAKKQSYTVPRRKFVRWGEQRAKSEVVNPNTQGGPVADYAISSDELWKQLVAFMEKSKDMGELAIQYKQFNLKRSMWSEEKYKEGVAVKDRVKARLEQAMAGQVEPGANEPNETPF